MNRSPEKTSLKIAGATLGTTALLAAGILVAPEVLTPQPSCSQLVVTKIGNSIIASADVQYYGNDNEVSITYSFGHGKYKNVVINPLDATQPDSVTYSYNHQGDFTVAASVKKLDGQQSKVFDPTSSCQHLVTIP